MTSRRQGLAFAALAALALAVTAAPAALPAPAAAQEIFRPKQTLSTVQMIGAYRGSDSTSFSLTSEQGGGLTISSRWKSPAGQEWSLGGQLAATVDGKGAEGTWVARPLFNTSDPNNKTGRMQITFKDGRVRVAETDGQPHPISDGEYWRTLDSDTSWARPYVGTWNVSGGVITFEIWADLLVGVYERRPPGGAPEKITKYIFSRHVSTGGSSVLGGAWGDYESGAGAEAILEFSADKTQLYLRSATSGGGRSEVLKRAAGSAGSGGYQPPIASGTPEPKPGYVSCRSWCRVRVVSSEARSVPSENGSFTPILFFKVKVHNASLEERELAADDGAGLPADALRFVFAKDQADRYANDDTHVTRSSGPYPIASSGYPTRDTQPIDKVALPAGAEAELTYAVERLPQEVEKASLWFDHEDDERSEAPAAVIDAKSVVCPWFKLRKQLDDSGDYIPYGREDPKALPAFCGGDGASQPGASGAGGTPGPVAQNDLPTNASMGGGTASDAGSGSGSTSSAGSASGSGSGSGTSGSGTSAGGRGGQVSDDGFKPLGRYGVKLETTEGRDDNRYQVIATLKNRTSGPLYLTSGEIYVFLEDQDGAAQQTGQVMRASAEPPAPFNSTPVIQPGATLRVRWIFRPDDIEKVAKVTFREGAKSADFQLR